MNYEKREIVSKIINGCTFETQQRKHPIRLANVALYESGHKDYKKALNQLENVLQVGDEVIIRSVATDNDGTTVAKVSIARFSVGQYMRNVDRR